MYAATKTAISTTIIFVRVFNRKAVMLRSPMLHHSPQPYFLNQIGF